MIWKLVMYMILKIPAALLILKCAQQAIWMVSVEEPEDQRKESYLTQLRRRHRTDRASRRRAKENRRQRKLHDRRHRYMYLEA